MMAGIMVQGGVPLRGRVRVQGAKNAILPMLAATVLTAEPCTFYGVPRLSDVGAMKEILATLGSEVAWDHSDPSVLSVQTRHLHAEPVPPEQMARCRSSIFLLGPLLARVGEATMGSPGGCDIGLRPIDLHLKGLRALGAEIDERHDGVYARTRGLVGAQVHLDFPSVGATENLMMAAVLAEGQTVISNAAREPELVDLQNFLNALGAHVRGAGTDSIRIIGVKQLGGAQYTPIPDRIEAGTLMLAALVTRGEITVEGVIPEHLTALHNILLRAGADLIVGDDRISVAYRRRLSAMRARTQPYPGFPTDLQPPLVTLMALAQGTSHMIETIFENRFQHIDGLRAMGGRAKITGNTVTVEGTSGLRGAVLEAHDLRGGAALLLAALAAEGESTLFGFEHVLRGYDALHDKLQSLGGKLAPLKERSA